MHVRSYSNAKLHPTRLMWRTFSRATYKMYCCIDSPLYYILINYYPQYASAVVTSRWIFKTYSVLICFGGHRPTRAPPDPPRPHDRATPAPHSCPSCPPAKEGAPPSNSASGGRGKVPSRGRLARSPGKEGILGKGGVSIISGGIYLPGFVSCPRFGVYI